MGAKAILMQSGFYLALFVHRHVHPDEFLVGLTFRAFFAKAQRWVDGFEHVKDFGIMNFSTEKLA